MNKVCYNGPRTAVMDRGNDASIKAYKISDVIGDPDCITKTI